MYPLNSRACHQRSHSLPSLRHSLSVQVRGLFTCSTASTPSMLSIWDTGKREPQTRRTKPSPGRVCHSLKTKCNQGNEVCWDETRDYTHRKAVLTSQRFVKTKTKRFKNQTWGRAGCRRVQIFSMWVESGLKQPGQKTEWRELKSPIFIGFLTPQVLILPHPCSLLPGVWVWGHQPIRPCGFWPRAA